MSRRCRHYCDDSDSDVDLPRSGRASRSAASRKGGEFGLKGRKEQSRPWSQEESEWLIQVVSKTSTNLDNINWQDVAKQVPGRTGKQCREKWKNDLRPNICKEPWSLKEEYVLAVAHSLHGNRWSEVAKYLPTRPENTIKNRWYATNRAKAEVKIRTFLWLYSDLVDRQSYPAGPEAIDKARELYRQLPDVVPLEEFEVPVDFYIARSENGCPAQLDTRPEIKIIGRGKAKPHVPGATTVGGGGGGGGSSAAAAVLSAVRGAAAAAASASRSARTAIGGGSGAASAAANNSASTTGAAAVAPGPSSKGKSGDSAGCGHSEGDANCYVKVGGLAGELPSAGPIKTTSRKRKVPGLVEGFESALPAANSVHKMVKIEPSGPDGLGISGAGDATATATATISSHQRAPPMEGSRTSPLPASHMTAPPLGPLVAPSPAASATAAASAVTITTGAGRGAGGPGGSVTAEPVPAGHVASPLDPELLWQTAVEPYSNQNNSSNNLNGHKGRRTSTATRHVPPSRAGGATHMHPAAAAAAAVAAAAAAATGMYSSNSGGITTNAAVAITHSETDNLQSLFSSSSRMVGSEGGASSAADLGLFPLGPGALNGLLEDHDGTTGGGSTEADQDLLSLTDGLDLASLTALIGPHDVHGEGPDCAHEAMAGLAEDVLSQMPDPATPRMPQQHAHHGQIPQRIAAPAPQAMGANNHQHGQHNQHQQHQNQQHPHHYGQQHLSPPVRHAASMGSAQQHQRQQQQQPASHHPHSMSQGSYPLHMPQSLMQSHESACTPAPQPLSQSQQIMTRGGAPMSHQQQQQQPQGPGDLSSTPMSHQLQQQQQSVNSGAHDVTGGQPYMYQRRLPPGVMPSSSRPPATAAAAAAVPPGHHPLAQHPMYGSPSYMPHPHSHSHPGAPSPATPAPMMHPGSGGGGRQMLPGGPSPSPVKYAMASPYAGPPPPGAPYGGAPPPPPYMMPMGMRGGYYKMPGGRMPMPRSMMYPPPYGMTPYSHHGMASGYMDSPPPGMGPAGDGAVHHPQQGGQMDPCTPATMGSSIGGPLRASSVLSQGGAAVGGPAGGGVESLAAMGPMGMGRAYGDMGSAGPTGPGAGQGM
ncbi:hypothetical protein Vretimale_3210 [Volvox reticuliferus]|uniref:Uncharacterized protein n=1 Tax=Volvox reticuliferus TaxID=1737510 RepID=A0A8J4D976_9CHLO|nr:hypothetical protein Vretifemale_6663 [Volvox reticuliferus]GIL97584.1 hypothetical protein Vretimale_3210 [Volvox reticuliferus]